MCALAPVLEILSTGQTYSKVASSIDEDHLSDANMVLVKRMFKNSSIYNQATLNMAATAADVLPMLDGIC